MDMYVACGLTESRDREVVHAIVSYLESQGHQVLDEHVAHENHRARFTENTCIILADRSEVEKEIIIHDVDLAWVRRAEGFIGIFFSASEGASIEFEHRRLLLHLQRVGKIPDNEIRSKLFLCIFLKDRKRSALLHGISLEERKFIIQEYVDKKEDALDVVKRHLEALSERVT